jgi:hypothetical protein
LPLHVTVGQVMVAPQLVVAEPPQRPLHAVPSYVQPQPFAPAPPPPQVFGGVQVLVQVIAWPQLFVAGPHARPLHAVVLSGVQHVSLARHTPAFGHVLEQVTGWPQLFVTVWLHRPLHVVVTGSGVQQTLFTQTSVDELQLTVPPLPHDVGWPQLFVTEPQVAPLQVVATGSGTQPHAPLLQVAPPSQPGQVTALPQLSVTGPQWVAHHWESGSGTQHELFEVQVPASPQSPHATLWPQLFVALVLHWPPHAASLSGAQQVPSDWQTAPPAHVVVPFTPQAMTWPQLFVAAPQFMPAHVVSADSGLQPHELATQLTPPSQLPQVVGLPQLS